MRSVLKPAVLIFIFISFSACALFGQTLFLGVNSSFHLQNSANTLRITLGLGARAGLTLDPFEFEARAYLGTLIAYSVWAELNALVIVPLGQWRPRIGVSVNLDGGDYLFHASSSADLVQPALPEAGIGIVIKFLVFNFGRFQITAGRLMVGTDFQYFGRVLVAELELFGIAYGF
jgi:hypothetical protein